MNIDTIKKTIAGLAVAGAIAGGTNASGDNHYMEMLAVVPVAGFSFWQFWDF